MENLEPAVQLTPNQEALWLLWKLEPDNPTYHIGAAVRVDGNLDLKRLQKVWQEVTRRHDALSRRFELRDRKPVQVFSKAHADGFEVRATPPSSLEQVLQQPFDLEHGFVARLVIWRESEAWIMVYAMHHIVGDAWSAGLIARDIEQLYAGQALCAAKSYLEFVTDHPSSSILKPLHGRPARSAGLTQLELPVGLLANLRQYARQHSVTLSSLLQAVYRVWLWRLTGSSDGLAIPILGRSRSDLKTVGLFTQLQLIDIPFEPEMMFLELLKITHDATWASLRNSRIQTGTYRFLFNHLARPLHFRLSGLKLTPLELRQQETQAELVLTVLEHEHGVKLNFTSPNLQLGVLNAWADCYLHLLEHILASCETPISKLELLPLVQREQLERWSDGGEAFSTDQTVIERFEARVMTQPETLALFGNEALTYKQLNARANAVAQMLLARGLQAEQVVGLQIPRSVESIIAMLGVLKAGGAYWSIPDLLPVSDLPRVTLQVSDINSFESEVNPKLEFRPSTAYVIRTSGTTGTPKTIRVGHRSLSNYSQHAVSTFGLDSTDRVLQFASLSFDAHVEEVFPTLICGASLVLRNENLDARAFFAQLVRRKITVISLPTAYFAELSHQARVWNLPAPKDLKLCVVGGEALKSQSLKDWQLSAPNAVVLNTYGPTEATVAVTTSLNCALGKPIPGARLEIKDSNGRLVPVGVVGELEITGIVLAQNVDAPYRTGDLARWNLNGELEFIGRNDAQIKISGFRVDILEIEQLLERAGAHTVRVQLDANGWLCAYLVGKLEANTIRLALENVPIYARPKRFAFLETMPVTTNGKIDARALFELATQALEVVSRAPRTRLELELLKLFQTVLNLEHLGMDSDFFDLGGDSLRALELTLKLEQLWNLG